MMVVSVIHYDIWLRFFVILRLLYFLSNYVQFFDQTEAYPYFHFLSSFQSFSSLRLGIHHYPLHLLYSMRKSPVIHIFRSEEHTSELQSRGHLVCRLLLEKKKKARASTSF